jgi:hypothetical protein
LALIFQHHSFLLRDTFAIRNRPWKEHHSLVKVLGNVLYLILRL